MKKIMFILPSFGRGGGTEKIATYIINYFAEHNYDVVLVLVKERGKYFDKVTKNLKLIELNTSSVKFSLFKIVKTIKTIKPDVVFSFGSEFNILMGFLKNFFNNIKFIGRESTIISKYIEIYNKNYLIYKFLYKFFYNKLDIIIAQSNYMKNDLVNKMGISKNKIIVINNPIDMEKFKKYNIIQKKDYIDNIYLLCIGRLSKEKGFDKAIKAMSKLDERFYLTIIGSGEEENKLKELVKKLNLESRVTFKGFQKDPYKYLSNSDFLLLTSNYEGFPNVVLEAMVLGVPTIAFEMSGGTSEIIINGKNGLIVKPNYEDLGKAILKATTLRFDRNIIMDMAKKYELDRIMKLYERLIL